jgi:hypothetical protein
MDTDRDRTEREERLPEHESDADVADTVGGGMMKSGGTVVDRGTGELTWTAQGDRAGTPVDEADPNPSQDEPLGYPMSPGDSGYTGITGATVAADEERADH